MLTVPPAPQDLLKKKGMFKHPAANPILCAMVRGAVTRHPGASSAELARLLNMPTKKVKVALSNLLWTKQVVRHRERSAYWNAAITTER